MDCSPAVCLRIGATAGERVEVSSRKACVQIATTEACMHGTAHNRQRAIDAHMRGHNARVRSACTVPHPALPIVLLPLRQSPWRRRCRSLLCATACPAGCAQTQNLQVQGHQQAALSAEPRSAHADSRCLSQHEGGCSANVARQWQQGQRRAAASSPLPWCWYPSSASRAMRAALSLS